MASDPVVLFSNCEILGSTYRETLLSLKLANCKYATLARMLSQVTRLQIEVGFEASKLSDL